VLPQAPPKATPDFSPPPLDLSATLELLEPLRASLMGGGNRNIDLNELSGELTLWLAGIDHFYVGRGHCVV
jgi:hypothetical protein